MELIWKTFKQIMYRKPFNIHKNKVEKERIQNKIIIIFIDWTEETEIWYLAMVDIDLAMVVYGLVLYDNEIEYNFWFGKIQC